MLPLSNNNMIHKIAVLASGRGSNLQSIIDAKNKGSIKSEIVCVLSDKNDSLALKRAKDNNIEPIFLDPKNSANRNEYHTKISQILNDRGVTLVILAGYMRIVTKELLDCFPVMNIHPALLPSFPGLYGQKQALEYGVKIAGCTVHFVDEGMDTGPIILQACVRVADGDDEKSLSERIIKEEHRIYPQAITLFEDGRLKVDGRRVMII